MRHLNKFGACAFCILGALWLLGDIPVAFAAHGHGNGHGNDDSNGSGNSGGSRICVTSSGDIRVRGKCRVNKGETRLTASNLATFADIALVGIPSGETVTGVIGGSFDAAATGADWSLTSSLPATVVPALSSTTVIVDTTIELLAACGGVAANCLAAEEVLAAATCTGNTTNVTAPAGTVCIYPYAIANADSIIGVAPSSGGASTGISVNWNAPATGSTAFGAVWAYTAP